MKFARWFLVLITLVPFAAPAQDATTGQNEVTVPLHSGITFLEKQNQIYTRNAWTNRYIGWVCGWGAAVLAAFTSVSAKLFPDKPKLPIVTGLLATALVAVTQTVKPESLGDAYYRGHILIENVLGDAAMGKATPDDLSNAWHQAQGGLPWVTPTLVKPVSNSNPGKGTN